MKTRVILRRDKSRHKTPGFINGELPRGKSVKKAFFYFFDARGDLQVTIVPVKMLTYPHDEQQGTLL